MTETCRLLDRYRDGELSASEHTLFESHLGACQSCRTTIALLDNVVCLIGKAETELHPAFAERTAELAFRQDRSWDAVIISWLRLDRALPVCALLVLLCSSILLVPVFRHTDAYGEYEALLAGSEINGLSNDVAQIHNDDDLLRWLQQEGNSR